MGSRASAHDFRRMRLPKDGPTILRGSALPIPKTRLRCGVCRAKTSGACFLVFWLAGVYRVSSRPHVATRGLFWAFPDCEMSG
jgi:hypothetical protein